jgi:hypothetical protein
MTTAVRLALLFLALVLLIGLGLWYYLFGPNKIESAELVPADTAIFASIPNAGRIAADYPTSRLKQLADAPETKPLLDQITARLGQKNLDLLQAFAPLLSGQSFIAFTHFDPEHPAQSSVIAALKPKAGLGNFDAFIDQLKSAYPGWAAQTTSGAAQVEGLDYRWVQGPNLTQKLCVAQVRGWIVTATGEAALQDWWERFQKKPATPSLAQNDLYQKSLKRIGKDPEAILYVAQPTLASEWNRRLATENPAGTDVGGSASPGAMAIGTGFEQGDLADHFSVLIPRPAQAALGLASAPCPFETIKFTSPDTRFYWGAAFNWTQVWANLQTEASQAPQAHPLATAFVDRLQGWAQRNNLDVARNIIAPLGAEVSVQTEWSADTSFPETGFFLKLDRPDDFKPALTALIETIRADYADRSVVNEINANGHNFATLKFVQALPVSPTITEDGPYLGIFLTENQAVRSFQRDESVGLLNNGDFQRQIGANRTGASQLVFLDAPQLLDRGYQTALPFLSLASLLNPRLGALAQAQNLPQNLQWLAPMDTWSFVVSADDDGLNGYSISGIGNQGALAMGVARTASRMLPVLGSVPALFSRFLPAPPAPPAPVSPPSLPSPVQTPPPGAPDTNAPAASAPAPAPAPVAPAITPTPSSPASTNAVPAPAASIPSTNVPSPAPASTNAP